MDSRSIMSTISTSSTLETNYSELSDNEVRSPSKGSAQMMDGDIKSHRVVFKWLPVYFSNDLVHGAIWFVYGSVFSIIIPIVPLLDIQYHFFKAEDGMIHF